MPPPTPIFAFGFSNLAMLGWLAAAAAPILIHLWSRRRYREMSWAAMEYLLAAMRQSSRRLQLEQLLLLLIRTLIVVLIVLAVSEPYLESGGFVFTPPGQRTHRVLVVDGSYSMAYKPTDISRFDRAKQLAARLVEESPLGDGFSLVLMSAPPRVVVGTPALEPAEFRRQIDELVLPHTTADLPTTLAKVEEILVNAGREYPQLTRREVYFLTDLGRVGWLPEFSDASGTREFRKRAEWLGESAGLVVIDVGQADAENQAVTGLRTAAQYAVPGQNVRIEAELKNFGRRGQKGRQVELLVELLVDGRRVGRKPIDLPAGASASVGFSHRFETPGDHVLQVRLEGDRLDIDNHRWLALPVKQSIRVLCIDGRPSGKRFQSATGYLAAALAPDGEDSLQAIIRPEVKPESGLLESTLGSYDCVFLSNVPQFTSSEARVLRSYVAGGGGLVIFLGDRVLADRYNQRLFRSGSDRHRLLPARLGPIVEPAQAGLDPLDYRHPIVRPFRGRQQAGLLSTPVDKYFKLNVPSKSKARIALAVGSGDPMIVEEPIGRGRVVLVATSADTSWTAMPIWPSYVPIVQELLAWAIGGQLRQQNVLVGETLGSSVPATAAGAPLEMLSPDGRAERLPLRHQVDYSSWGYSETMTSGVYTVRFGPPLSRSDRFAVNVDTLESDLEKLTEEQLRRQVWPGVALEYLTTWEHVERQPAARIGRRGSPAKGLLYAVLGLLFAEIFLAWRFGYHTT